MPQSTRRRDDGAVLIISFTETTQRLGRITRKVYQPVAMIGNILMNHRMNVNSTTGILTSREREREVLVEFKSVNKNVLFSGKGGITYRILDKLSINRRRIFISSIASQSRHVVKSRSEWG
jgi:hypothetical protein